MKLTKIKLAGFKSFVDPTSVLLPTHLVAVVGPNGCGKSNIIDAVCWVMGESSAKLLRGESLTDVIFNGSTARKPVGQASVELIFDNSDGSIGGEYASFAEVSIRRQINRESESSYFLNNTRCRRRDIIDIFLGTGLGPRSYSIIGQNMIQRVIEARPEDMRVYLEEAAGVSKYKERRRETENRIQHTKENLLRLSDVQNELDKQITLLKRQCNAAEKFKILKQEERTLRGQWLAIQWRQCDARLVNETLQIQQQSTGLEARQAELSEINLQFEYKRDSQRLENEQFQDIQRHYYSIGSEVTRLEQALQHLQEKKHQIQLDYEQAELDWMGVQKHLEESELEAHELTQEIQEVAPAVLAATDGVEQAKKELLQAEEKMQSWQAEWDICNQVVAKNTQLAEVEQTHLQHIEQKIASLTQRKIKFEQEQAQFNFSQLESDIKELAEQSKVIQEQSNTHQAHLAQARQKIIELKLLEQKTANHLHQTQNELQVLNGKQASLQAIQETALGQRDNTLIPWLKTNKLDKNPRLAQCVEVEAGWEKAVEIVLGEYLQAVCVDQLENITALTDQLAKGSLFAITKNKLAVAAIVKPHSLLTKVQSSWPLASLLADIYTAESKEAALEIASSLAAHESVITPDGIWLGPTWLSVVRDQDLEAGVFQREQSLKQLAKHLEELAQEQAEITQTVSNTREQLKTAENQRDEMQREANKIHAQLSETQTQHKMQSQRLTELKKRAEQFLKDQTETLNQLTEADSQLTKTRTAWQQAMTALEKETPLKEALAQNRDLLRKNLQTARDQVNETQTLSHQLDVRLQTSQSQLSSLQQTIQRMGAQLTALNDRKNNLHKELMAETPVESLQKDLENALKGRLILQGELTNARHALETINQEMHDLSLKRQELEREISHFRDMLEALRIESQGARVKADTLLQQLQEHGFELENILQDLPDSALADEWHARLQQVIDRVHRLGAINLVAIEEHAACSERKEYLDSQYSDLTEGLTTLENAIDKIDKETRLRFKQTFDKVNTRFQELFPLVFGGGQAYLELTGDNLLDTGITVMACPPGKRNSTIHLLSGGEKAMTAVALVFSIFHLNPAPFCLLDEVDAPLDDANIGRFCQLVKTMSEKTQFIFISHNKLAIEMAETLIGVTMNEPGVSRLVTVDVQQAIDLAGV